jgi:hypothetical protein
MPAVVTLGFWFFCRSTGCVDAQLLRLKHPPGSLEPAVSGLLALEALPESSLEPLELRSFDQYSYERYYTCGASICCSACPCGVAAAAAAGQAGGAVCGRGGEAPRHRDGPHGRRRRGRPPARHGAHSCSQPGITPGGVSEGASPACRLVWEDGRGRAPGTSSISPPPTSLAASSSPSCRRSSTTAPSPAASSCS